MHISKKKCNFAIRKDKDAGQIMELYLPVYPNNIMQSSTPKTN